MRWSVTFDMDLKSKACGRAFCRGDQVQIFLERDCWRHEHAKSSVLGFDGDGSTDMSGNFGFLRALGWLAARLKRLKMRGLLCMSLFASEIRQRLAFNTRIERVYIRILRGCDPRQG